MNWLNGGTLIWLWHGEGFKPWCTQIKLYFFGKMFFGIKVKGQGNPSSQGRAGKPS